MQKALTAFSLATALLLAFSAHAQFKPPPVQEEFEAGLIRGEATDGKTSQPYALYLPPDYDADEAWPLIVFLHGMGERGTDGLLQTRVGIGPAIDENPDRFPCLVLMPQCGPRAMWTHASSIAEIDDAIRQVREHYSVDGKRISLTGLSMGAFGLFAYDAGHIESFSATLVVCGAGDPARAPGLATRPMRVFHGADDFVVKPERSRIMVEAIRAAGGDVAYTVYPGTGHDSWVRAYGDPANIAWLLEQERP